MYRKMADRTPTNNTLQTPLLQTLIATQETTKQLNKAQSDAGIATQNSHEPDPQHFMWISGIIELDTRDELMSLMLT